MQDINKGNQFMGNNVVDTEYYILFKERKPEILQKNLRNIINGLASCGLNSVQVSNEDLRTLIENFLNGGMNTEYGTVISI
jgi:hypothetical protein